MLRACSRVIALSETVVGLSTAQAAEPQTLTLTLACKGTTIDAQQDDAKPEPISMGIIINFTNHTVQGFGYSGLEDYPVKISASNDVTVAFGGNSATTSTSITGSIDHVTGDVWAMSTAIAKTGKVLTQINYSLKCIGPVSPRNSKTHGEAGTARKAARGRCCTICAR